jgi:hypothetical protein
MWHELRPNILRNYSEHRFNCLNYRTHWQQHEINFVVSLGVLHSVRGRKQNNKDVFIQALHKTRYVRFKGHEVKDVYGKHWGRGFGPAHYKDFGLSSALISLLGATDQYGGICHAEFVFIVQEA